MDYELMTNTELREHIRALAQCELDDDEVTALITIFEVEGLLEQQFLIDKNDNIILDEWDEPVTTGRWLWSQDAGTNEIAKQILQEEIRC